MADSEHLRQVMVLDVTEVDEVRAMAVEHDVAVERVVQRGLDPLTSVAVVLVGAAFAVRVVERAVERSRGGQVIDLQPHALRRFARTRGLEYGTVVILGSDGAVTVRVTTERPADVLEALLTMLPRLAGADTGRTVEAVTEALGPDVDVTPGDARDDAPPPEPRQ